jgi:hypothetical protein
MDVRNEIVDAILKEIVGPSPNASYVDTETGEEVLLAKVHGSPKSRYGAGMLYPQQTQNKEVDEGDLKDAIVDVPANESEDESMQKVEEGYRNSSTTEKGIPDEEPVGLANQYLPSAMGFTIRFRKGEKNDVVLLKIESAYYAKGADQRSVKRVNKDSQIEIVQKSDGSYYMSDYWIRRKLVTEPILITINSLFTEGQRSFERTLHRTIDGEDWLKLHIFNRTTEEDYYTYTFVILNAMHGTTDDSVNNKYILYQNQLSASTENVNLIAPYRERNSSTDTVEENELNLLYRKKRVFAIGHGTAVNWDTDVIENTEKVISIRTSVIPIYDIPQVAPTSFVELSMFDLSDLGDWERSKKSLNKLASEYASWIEKMEIEVEKSPELKEYRQAAQLNVQKCRASLQRIERGINYLITANKESDLVNCFRWMNKAMIWQQQRAKTNQRKWVRTGTGKKVQYLLEGINDSNNRIFPTLEEFHKASTNNGRWRPFQLAFILMNIESIISEKSEERKIVDLIWFPTGGGKTEAYLGLSAFNIFYRRIKGKKDWNWNFFGGTTVLMRYTLRLLTTQQYERASSLICACDLIRRNNESSLGDEPISIGLWVGGNSTPNDNEKARAQYSGLNANKYEPYNFIVLKCPCCGSQIGKLDGVSKDEPRKIKGLIKEDGKGGKVNFQCENPECEYADMVLPLLVVDDYIYEKPPTLLLGTVDKFAMITWKREAGRLFGFRNSSDLWSRITPPELIIQDELHLISGPLGTMVGLYETMVQTLCNNYHKNAPPFISSKDLNFVPPKIVASSATISRAKEQVNGLYGTDNLNIFPAQGLEFGNTWFSEEKTISPDFPGRKYVGILASGYPSAQTSIVRAYSAVLQKVKELESQERIDYYWTLLGYFNSIRELGGASSLVHGDIRERLGQIQNRELIHRNSRRYLNKTEELTSRVSSGEIPEILKKLEEQFKNINNQALDICLATNMIATGVDISRLGIMFIHGQPKTSAEYIQASSRVGRKLPDGPGIIFTLYSPAKPRDKSQYEQFQGFHSRIYSNVEPTSVTPFSINARERALHAILIGMVRHFAGGALRESPRIDGEEFDAIIDIICNLIVERCRTIDKDEVKNTELLLQKRIAFWKRGFQHYGDPGNFGILNDDGFVPLMYANGSEVRDDIKNDNRSLSTPTSMRGVDTESVISIYSNNETDGKE